MFFLEGFVMKIDRRGFIGASVGASLGGGFSGNVFGGEKKGFDYSVLDAALKRPVLKRELFSSAVKIASVDLYKGGKYYFVRVRSVDGAEGIAVAHANAKFFYTIFNRLVRGTFVGRDARDLDAIIDSARRNKYKMSGLILFSCIAWCEFAVLDMLGKIAGKSTGELIGEILQKEVKMYSASGNRGNTPEEEIKVLKAKLKESGTKAVKLKVGGRMSNNADSRPGRTEGLIKIVRKELGDDVTIWADANGSYDARKGIEIGKMLEDYGIEMFEEPCPFDHLEDTKKVADAISIPVSGGEQEASTRRFRWMIANGAVQVVQPDLHYFGGFIRATRVARMAEAAGMKVIPHMSGSGTGYVEAVHFASFTPNIGPLMEYKGGIKQTGKWYDPPLRFKDGAINVPKGPGMGVRIDKKVLSKAEKMV